MILAGERWPGEIAQIERLDLRRLRVAILQSFLAGFHGERTKIAIRERAKGGLPDADDGDWSHAFSITAARAGMLSTFLRTWAIAAVDAPSAVLGTPRNESVGTNQDRAV